MIWVTGDTHCDVDYRKVVARNDKKINRGDTVIITGDFGGVWYGTNGDNKVLNRYEKNGLTILFVDGNHENHDKLDSLPVEIWNGGKVHKVRENIIHLMRGQIYTIEGKTIFTMGGGTSIDKQLRIEEDAKRNYNYIKYGSSKRVKTWWDREQPSDEEISEAITNLQKVNYEVDYIITHTCGLKVMHDLLKYPKESTRLNTLLDWVQSMTKYDKWYFGHFHGDIVFEDINLRLLYDDVIKLGE